MTQVKASPGESSRVDVEIVGALENGLKVNITCANPGRLFISGEVAERDSYQIQTTQDTHPSQVQRNKSPHRSYPFRDREFSYRAVGAFTGSGTYHCAQLLSRRSHDSRLCRRQAGLQAQAPEEGAWDLVQMRTACLCHPKALFPARQYTLHQPRDLAHPQVVLCPSRTSIKL